MSPIAHAQHDMMVSQKKTYYCGYLFENVVSDDIMIPDFSDRLCTVRFQKIFESWLLLHKVAPKILNLKRVYADE